MTNDNKTPEQTTPTVNNATERLYTFLDVSNRIADEMTYGMRTHPAVKVLSDQNALLQTYVSKLLSLNTEDAPPWARTQMAKRWHQIAAIAQRTIFENDLEFNRGNDKPNTEA